jgi:hypothetical protein
MGVNIDGRSWCIGTDGEQYAGEDVTVLGERLHENTPQNLIVTLSRAGSLAGCGSGGTCSR